MSVAAFAHVCLCCLDPRSAHSSCKVVLPWVLIVYGVGVRVSLLRFAGVSYVEYLSIGNRSGDIK